MGEPKSELKPLPLKERLDECPVCFSGSWLVAFPPDVVRCAECRTLFRNPRPLQSVIAESYNQGATYARWREQDEDFDRLWSRRRDFILRRKKIGRLLDVGAGDGRFLKKMAEVGFSVTGTELSDTGAGLAEKAGFELKLGQFTDLEFENADYDVITLWHVLEHVPNPGEVLKRVYDLLAPYGLFVVAVPNEAHAIWKSKFSRSRPFEPLVWQGEIHLTHFEPYTLQSALKSAGFEVLTFEVDDFYPNRDWKNRAKIGCYKLLSRVLWWHPAAAMLCVCRKQSG